MAYNALEICGLSLLLVTSEISPVKISKRYPLDKWQENLCRCCNLEKYENRHWGGKPILCDPMTAAHQAPLSMRFPRQGYWSGAPFPSPGHLPNPRIEPRSPALQADSLLTELQAKPILISSCSRMTLPCISENYPHTSRFGMITFYVL